MTGHNGQGVSWQAYAYEDHYLRHFNGKTCASGADGGPLAGDAATSWADDTSWRPVAPWAG